MKHTITILATLLLAPFVEFNAAAPPTPGKPNILFIVSDDLRSGDFPFRSGGHGKTA